MTKIIDISEFWEGEGKPEVEIKRLSFGAQNNILDQVANINVEGKNVKVNPQYGRLRTLTLQKCLVSAPFSTTLEYIENELDSNLGDFLFEQVDAYNNFKKDKKKVLEVFGGG
jgi:hypothetical protein